MKDGPRSPDASHCRDVRERIYEYLDEEMPESDRASLSTHLDLCPRCRETAARERAFLAAVRERAVAQDPCPERVRARIAEAIRRRRTG